jgi:hypothetical protein
MTPQLLIFLVAMGYLCWVFFRYLKQRSNKGNPFIEVLDDQQQAKPPPQRKPDPENADENEWRRRIRAEIEDMTK